jgi:excisionase family DNA binding protein
MMRYRHLLEAQDVEAATTFGERMTEPIEVIVVNAAYWADHAPQLAQILRGANERGSAPPIGDPSGRPPKPDTMATVVDPGYWAGQPAELRDALTTPQEAQGHAGTSRLGVGAVSTTQERLTLTVEEAAAVLGISRAFAYEAVRRGEVPSIKIGRRVLVPRAALERMLDVATGPDDA